MDKPSWRSPYFLLTLTMLFWASNTIVARAIVDLISPISISFLRWAVALLCLLPFGLPHLLRERHVIYRHWALVSLLALLSVAAFNTLLYMAATRTTAINLGLIGAIEPAIIPVVAWCLFGDGIGLRQAAGIPVAFAGSVVLIMGGHVGDGYGLSLNIGDFLMLAAVICWALYSVLLRQIPDTLHPLSFLTATLLIGVFCLAPLYFWERAVGVPFVVTPGVSAAILYTGMFPSLLAFAFWNRGVAALGAQRAGAFLYLIPVFTVILAMTLLEEKLAWHHLIGGLLIFLGVYVAGRK